MSDAPAPALWVEDLTKTYDDLVALQPLDLEVPAGQSVFHLHFHVIPRFEGVALRPHTGGMEENDVLAAGAEKIRAVFAGT